MPVSNLAPRAIDKLTSQQIADLALQADQESRRLHAAGKHVQARTWDLESARLAEALNR